MEVPSVFAWSEEKPETVARSAVEKLNTSRQEEEEATDTASEGESEGTLNLSGLTFTSRKTQTQEDDFCDEITDISHRIPCLHRFSVYHFAIKVHHPLQRREAFHTFHWFQFLC